MGDFLADRYASDPQQTARAVVRLHQDADGIPAGAGVQFARRGSRAALESVADHPGAAADVSLGDASARRALDRRDDMFRLHVKSVDVVQRAVPRLGDDRQRPRLEESQMLGGPLDRRVAHDADAMRIGDEYRTLEKARFLDPGRAGHLAVAVQRKPAGEHRVL